MNVFLTQAEEAESDQNELKTNNAVQRAAWDGFLTYWTKLLLDC